MLAPLAELTQGQDLWEETLRTFLCIIYGDF